MTPAKPPHKRRDAAPVYTPSTLPMFTRPKNRLDFGGYDMDDFTTDLGFRAKPTAERPLMGLTILVVEDSRFASEALRLLCLRSGARIRRADCLASARRHLQVYRPTAAIIDLGLPDGSGLELISELAEAGAHAPVILATSGAEREAAHHSALQAGAHGFLPKPLDSLGAFQAEVLRHLPADLQPAGPRPVPEGSVHPDELAFREDLAHAIELLNAPIPPVAFVRSFLIGVARAAHDRTLEDLAIGFAPAASGEHSALRRMISDRIAEMAPA